jgi:hypothetical protein
MQVLQPRHQPLPPHSLAMRMISKTTQLTRPVHPRILQQTVLLLLLLLLRAVCQLQRMQQRQ